MNPNDLQHANQINLKTIAYQNKVLADKARETNELRHIIEAAYRLIRSQDEELIVLRRIVSN